MAIFNAMNYANSDAYIKSNLLYMNLFTGKSESHKDHESDLSFLANMTLYLLECKNIVSYMKMSLDSNSKSLESITEDMEKHFLIDSDKHTFLNINSNDIKVYNALKDFEESLSRGDHLFNDEMEHLIEHANLNLEKGVLPTMKDKIYCIKSSISYSPSEEDNHGILDNDLSKDELVSAIKTSKELLSELKENLLDRIDSTINFIDKLIKVYNTLSNDDLSSFKLSAIYVNITLGMQMKILASALDKYNNYSKLYSTRFDILKGECD